MWIGDAQGCQICIIMLWYDKNEISKLVIVIHLVALFSMVGPPSPKCCPMFYNLPALFICLGLACHQKCHCLAFWALPLSVLNSLLCPHPSSISLGLGIKSRPPWHIPFGTLPITFIFAYPYNFELWSLDFFLLSPRSIGSKPLKCHSLTLVLSFLTMVLSPPLARGSGQE
jgi:hypothetical protein